MSNQEASPATRGHGIFRILGIVLFVLALLGGLRYTADCIQEERRGGTLDLLRLTGLRGFDIIAGKLTANSLGAFFSLVAAFPILGVPLLLGGVSGWDLLKVTLLLAATLLLSLAIGIFASSQNATHQAALRQTAIITAVISAVGLVGLFYLRSKTYFERRNNEYPGIEHSTDFVVLFFVFVMMVTFGLPLGAPAVILWRILMFSPSILAHIGFGLSFAILVGLIFYFLKKANPFDVPAEQEERVRSVALWQARLNRGRFQKHMDPILWLASRTRPNGFALTWLAVCIAVFQYTAITARNSFVASGAADLAAFLLFNLLVFILARRASTFLSESHENGMLEVLLTTPLSWRHLFAAQKSAFAGIANWPLGIIAASEVAAELSLLGDYPNREFRIIGLLAPLLTILSYFLCREAILWGSLLFASQSKNAFHSAGKVTLFLVITPGLATYLLPFDRLLPRFAFSDVLLVIVFYIVIFGMFAMYARAQLQRHFAPLLVTRAEDRSFPAKMPSRMQGSSGNKRYEWYKSLRG